MKTIIPLSQVKIGDVVLDERQQTVRIPRTTKYKLVGTEIVRGVVTETPSSSNRYAVIIQFPEGLRSRNGRFMVVER